MDSQKYKKLIEIMEKACRVIKKENEIEEWIKFGKKNIKLLKKLLKVWTLSQGQKVNIQTTIIQLQSLSEQFKNKRKGGKGIGGNTNRKLTDRVKWIDLESIFQGRMRTGVVVNLQHIDLRFFLQDSKKMTNIRIKNILKKGNNLKVNGILSCKFQVMKNDEMVEETKYFNTKNDIILQTTNLNVWFDENLIDKLLSKVEEFQERDSGWTLKEIINLTVNINLYEPIRGGLSTYIEMPQFIKNKRAVVNIQNYDEYCFLWSVTAALNPVTTHSERVSSYPDFRTILKYEGIQFPIVLKDVPKFEKMNNLTINIYGIECEKKSEIVPIYLSKFKSNRKTIHLLIFNQETLNKKKKSTNDNSNYNFIDNCNDSDFFFNEDYESDENEEKSQTVFHFAWIRNLSRLISSQISKDEHKLTFCDRCLCHFSNQKSFKNHSDDCFNQNNAKMIMPDQENNILKFKNYKFKEPAPFSIYADLECILKPETNEKDLHIPYSVGYYFHCIYDNSLSKFKLNRGEKCIEWFVNELKKITEDVNIILNNPVPMELLTHQQEIDLYSIEICHICEKPFKNDDIKTRDHCHFTGRIRGLAHVSCNLQYQKSHVIPVFFHNLSGFDSFFIIKSLANQFEGSIKLLPINKEKYVSFTKEVRYQNFNAFNKTCETTCIQIRFLDSFKFMPSSLDKLASYLNDCDKKITRKYCNSDEEFQLLKRKGSYPYEFTDSFEKLNETKLPPKEKFFSKLSNQNISDDDYQHAIKVWNIFQIKTLGEYSDIYLRADVLLLADVFENFRKNCISNYGLDPIHYYTIPGYSFDCMLKCTEVELELLTDSEKYLFIEKGIRGGVAQCTNRYAKANNHYMPDFNPNLNESYIMYYDINNLYGHSMMNYLPYGGFEWEDNFNIDIFKIENDSHVGYIFEVDLEYPENLFEDHRDFPLCPEHLVPPNSKEPKLMTTLYPKKNYVIHYRSLKQYLKLGMKITKIHRILKFKQSPWLKRYIDFNTKKRQESTNAFGVLIFKLLNNVIYGKAIENLRNRRDVKMITKWDGRYGAKALIAKPNFHSSMILGEDLVVIEMTRVKIKFDKPIYVGFSILDISKFYLYDFHYDYVKKTFKDCAKLLYMDTDALAYLFTVPDIYECMKKNLEKFDTSDYDENNIYNMPLVNKKVIGLMKDENNGKIVTEFVGLRAKAYSMKILNDYKIIKKAKGVKRSVMKEIEFNDYKECLFNHKNLIKKQYLIRSKKHIVHTFLQTKLALSWQDDKRILLPNSTDTVPWGYKKK